MPTRQQQIHSYLERFHNLVSCNAIMLASCVTFVRKSQTTLTRFYMMPALISWCLKSLHDVYCPCLKHFYSQDTFTFTLQVSTYCMLMYALYNSLCIMPTPSQGPYIRTEIPLVVMFRALGIVADRDILERIVSSRPAVSIELTEMQKRLNHPKPS